MLGLLTYRGRQNLLNSVRRNTKSWKQRYLTASDDSHFGALTSIVKPDAQGDSDRLAECDLTPRLPAATEVHTDTNGEVTVHESKLAADFEWPILRDRASSRYLKHFMYSFKNIYSENINTSNLMFVTGPTKCGKSVLLRQNLRDFVSTGSHVSS